jgi:hypothetical protein
MPKDKQKKADRKKKAGKKTAQLAIRIEKAERDAFVTLCEAQDTSAAREIRRFMREYVAAHSPAPVPEPAAEAEAKPAAEAAPKPRRKAAAAAETNGEETAPKPARRTRAKAPRASGKAEVQPSS